MHLLIVCTANRCRSPLAEVIARRHLDELGIIGDVHSAGTAAVDGAPATDGAVATARGLGLDLSSHRSRIVTPELVAAADLVLTMEPQQSVRIVTDLGGDLTSTFTLPEFARMSSAAPRRVDGESLLGWIRGIAEGRSPNDALAAESIADPIGGPMRQYRNTARAIETALAVALDRSVPPFGRLRP